MSGFQVRAVSPDGIITTVVGGTPTAIPEPIRNNAIAADTSLGDAAGLAVSPAGVLYLAPEGANEVFILERGHLVEIVRPSQLIGVDPLFSEDRDIATYGIAFDRSGDLFISTNDPYAAIVRKPDGEFRYVGVVRSQPANPFAAFGDRLYVAANYQIVRFSPDVVRTPQTAARTTRLVSNGFVGDFPHHQNLDPGGIAVTNGGDVVTDGNLYGAPGDGPGTHAVLVEISPAGRVTLLGEWGERS
jgi:hypothetical protein